MIRFTRAQKELIKSIETINSPDFTECFGWEWRTAVSLVKRGFIEVDRPLTDKLRHDDHFAAKLVDNFAEITEPFLTKDPNDRI